MPLYVRQGKLTVSFTVSYVIFVIFNELDEIASIYFDFQIPWVGGKAITVGYG